jgi:GNAT superfamily N-acetyltransferase
MNTIRPARPEEAEALSALAVRSKGYWAYTPEQMLVFSRELMLAPTDIAGCRAHVLEKAGQIIGFYTLQRRSADDVELEHIFVDPAALRCGVGSALFQHACSTAQAAGFRRLVIRSDPNAAGFYECLGAGMEGLVPSSIPGRSLPFFSLDLV